MRIRNNIQDSQQCSLPPYHLTWKVAEIVLFTINPTTLSATKLFNYFLSTLSPNSAQPLNIFNMFLQEEQKMMLEEERRKREDFEKVQQEKEKQLRGEITVLQRADPMIVPRPYGSVRRTPLHPLNSVKCYGE